MSIEKPWLKHYESYVPEHIDYPRTTLPQALEETARKDPDYVSIIFKDTKITYKEYMDAVKIMINLDINDSAFIALGLAMKVDGIWTKDKGYYKQNVLTVYSTKELLSLIKK